jgi:DNA-binding beta-propeller fold protein YncE
VAQVAAAAAPLLLLLLVSFVAYELTVNRRLPIPGIGRVEDEVQPPAYLYSISGPQGEDGLASPFSVEVSDDDRVFVADGAAGVVRVYTVEGDYLYSFSEIADGENTALGVPTYMQINSKGELFITDRRHRSIYVFTLDGEYLRKVAPADAEEAVVWGPLGLGFDEDDNLYVTDVGRTSLHHVIIFDEDGNEIRRFGTFAQANENTEFPGSFYFPNDILAVGDTIIVSDSNNRRLQVFSETGVFDRFVLTSGTPRGIDMDDDGRIYIADALAHGVDIYSSAGQRITGFGVNGFGPGQFRYTNDVALDRRGRIFVTDRLNHRVQVWGWPEPIPSFRSCPRRPASGACA